MIILQLSDQNQQVFNSKVDLPCELAVMDQSRELARRATHLLQFDCHVVGVRWFSWSAVRKMRFKLDRL